MKAEILTVGTEILLGDILNTNARYLSIKMAELGVPVYFHTTVGDNRERLKDALKIAFSRADIVITTGGLGPTGDDLTKETIAEYFGKNLIMDRDSLSIIEGYFKRMNRKMVESNKKQACFPEGAIILPNDNGTAPGCIVEESNKIAIMLPGPPFEMAPMFENHAYPYLMKRSGVTIHSRVLRLYGIGESTMAEEISDILESQTNPTIAPYAKYGEVTLRITAMAKDKSEAESLIKPVEEELRKRFKDYIYGTGDTTLENEVAKLLIGKKLTIAAAESCTGGLLSGKLVNYPGISEVFLEGAVTYSNSAKVNRLNVLEETLEKYGAVSENTALEMAEGVAKSSKADIGISTTGIAGPSGGNEDKPVGLVYIGLYIKGKTMFKKLNLTGNRQKIRERTVSEALNFLRLELLKL